MYVIEGNIGVGKSTLLNLIKKHLTHITVNFESVESWDKHESEASLLHHFYQDTSRWSYTMETFTLFTRVQEHLAIQAQETFSIAMMERSIYSGYYCFAHNGYLQGFLNDTEWDLYTKWFEFLAASHCKTPDGFIYLQTEPTICHQRAQKRNRASEKDVPLVYFNQIHEQHESFLIKKKRILKSLQEVPVLVLDATYNFESDEQIMHEYLEKINDFVLLTHTKKAKINPLKKENVHI